MAGNRQGQECLPVGAVADKHIRNLTIVHGGYRKDIVCGAQEAARGRINGGDLRSLGIRRGMDGHRLRKGTVSGFVQSCHLIEIPGVCFHCPIPEFRFQMGDLRGCGILLGGDLLIRRSNALISVDIVAYHPVGVDGFRRQFRQIPESSTAAVRPVICSGTRLSTVTVFSYSVDTPSTSVMQNCST